MSETEPKLRIFVSSALRDQAAADTVARALTEAGFEFHDDSADASDAAHAARSVSKMMRQSDAYVVIVSPSLSSPTWTAFEVGAAMAWGKPIFVVNAGKEPSPPYLSRFPTFSLAELEKLIASLQQEAEPLTEPERELLGKIHSRLGVPVDALLLDPQATEKLVEEFNRRSRSHTGANRLLRELLRLRKAGKLAAVSRSRRAIGQKMSG